MKKRRQGKGFLIKWIVLFIDLLVINGIFLLVYCLNLSDKCFSLGELKTVMLLLNFCYLCSLYFIPPWIHKPIIYADKVVKRAIGIVFLHAVLLITCLYFLYREAFSVWFITYYYLLFGVLFMIWQVAARKIITFYRKTGYNFKRLVIAGAGKRGQELYNELCFNSSTGYKILGFFDDNSSEQAHLEKLYLGNLTALEEFVLQNEVDEVYCALPNTQRNAITKIMNFCEKNLVEFFLVPEYSTFIKKSLILEPIATIPILAIKPEPLELFHNRLLKRFIDIVLSLIILLTVFPLLCIVIGTIIKMTSPGPVFFKQLRTGIYGKDFHCYKFRTMRPNDEADVKQATKHDPRLTKIGAILRKTNLDEMPQFINVLKGEMSIVGPRPHMLSQTKLYSSLIDKYMVRHSVKPGITGWAQITGFRGEINEIGQMEERVKRDVWYIENWNCIFDLKIIFLTALSMLKKERKNAY